MKENQGLSCLVTWPEKCGAKWRPSTQRLLRRVPQYYGVNFMDRSFDEVPYLLQFTLTAETN